jgi:hypothetical protein
MLVRIQKDWDFPNIKQQSPGFCCKWEGVEFTFDPVPECDLFIAYNPPSTPVKVRCPEGRKWLFIGESPIEQYRWQIDSFRYFDKIFAFWDDSVDPNIVHDQTSLPWHIGRSYDQLTALTLDEAILKKIDRLSWVTSNATHKEGHKLRMGLKDFLINNKFDFDLFGRGFHPIDDKFDAIGPYKYSLAIENFSCNDYWTEKIADCFLSWTVPIYWGAKNITSYFPPGSMIQIDPADPARALAIIREAVEGDYFGAHTTPLAEARDLILNKYQFFPHVSELLNRDALGPQLIKKRQFIPANQAHLGPRTGVSIVKQIIKRMMM